MYMLDKIPQTVFMAWVYLNTSKSILSAIIIHFMVNFTGELFAMSLPAEAVYIGLWWILAGVIGVLKRPGRVHSAGG